MHHDGVGCLLLIVYPGLLLVYLGLASFLVEYLIPKVRGMWHDRSCYVRKEIKR